jgi:hypothetical protein
MATCPLGNAINGTDFSMPLNFKHDCSKSITARNCLNILIGSNKGISPSTTVASKIPELPAMPKGIAMMPNTFA